MPLPQPGRRARPDEVAQKVPCAIDSQDEAATELSQVAHERHWDYEVRCRCNVANEQGRPIGIFEQMDDRLIILEAQGQHGKLTARQPDFEGALIADTQS